MPDDQDSENDGIQRELRARQKFSVAGAIGRAGSGLLKGESPIPRQVQTTTEIIRFIDQNTPASKGALKSILRRRVKQNQAAVERHLDNPILALREIIQAILDKEFALQEFVRQVDARWGEMFMEPPHFQKAGQNPHPDDEYTYDSVKQDLRVLLKKLSSEPRALNADRER